MSDEEDLPENPDQAGEDEAGEKKARPKTNEQECEEELYKIRPLKEGDDLDREDSAYNAAMDTLRVLEGIDLEDISNDSPELSDNPDVLISEGLDAG